MGWVMGLVGLAPALADQLLGTCFPPASASAITAPNAHAWACSSVPWVCTSAVGDQPGQPFPSSTQSLGRWCTAQPGWLGEAWALSSPSVMTEW